VIFSDDAVIFPRRYYSFLFVVIIAVIYMLVSIRGLLPSFVDQVYLTTRNKSPLTMNIDIIPHESFQGRHFIELNYHLLGISEEAMKSADEICVYSIAITTEDQGEITTIDKNAQTAWNYPGERITVTFPRFSPIPTCAKFTELQKSDPEFTFEIHDSESKNLTNELYGVNGYWYPYDGFTARFTLLVNYRLLKNGRIIVEEATNPNLSIRIESNPSWKIWVNEENTTLGKFARDIVGNKADKIATDIVISLDRPAVWQLIYPLVLTAILLLIGVFSLVDSLELFIGGAASLSFGIYGIRQVLSPTQDGFATILDVVIFGLYAAFAISLIISLVRVFAKERRVEILRELSDLWASAQPLEENEAPQKTTTRKKKKGNPSKQKAG
jgi:hypothetical protein